MKNSKKSSNIIIVSIIIVLFAILDLVGMFSLYLSYTKIINNNVNAIQEVKDINFYLRSIDNNILYSIGKIGMSPTADITEYTKNITMYTEKCDQAIQEYDKIELSKMEKSRFNLFKIYYQSYGKKIDSILDTINSKDTASAQTIYTQELLPVRNCTSELLDALNYLSQISCDNKIHRTGKRGEMMGIGMLAFATLLIIIVNTLDKRRKLASKQLEQSTETIMKQKSTIQTTTFKDIITDAYNRMSFLTDFENKKLPNDRSGYFIMFNIDGFHRINFNYSNDVGDKVLSETTARLTSIFENNKLYRTGSDEFAVLVEMPSDPESYNKVIDLINNAKLVISKPYQLNPGVVNISCSISCIYVNGECDVTSELLETASEAIKQGRMSGYGNTTFVNTENNQSYILSYN